MTAGTGTPPGARRALRLAHRGDWRAGPENSLAAMRAALANRACDGLEFDVRASRDGTPIVLHDETLLRVQGRPERPSALTTAELATSGIPTLAEVLEAAGLGPFLDIELKGDPIPAVIEVIEGARGPSIARTVVSSFEHATLAWVGQVRPGWRCWLNAEDLSASTIQVAVELKCRGVSADWRSINPRTMARAAAAGLEVAAWTVRRRPTVDRLDRLGVVATCVEAAALDGWPDLN
ncbi:MAG: glycerophosphodiester phosphodiesterase [Chloroflexota bacterium]